MKSPLIMTLLAAHCFPFFKKAPLFVLAFLMVFKLTEAATSSDFISLSQPDQGSGIDIPYRLFVPADYDPSKEYPLMLWLHGWGERGTDNSSQLGGPFSDAINSFLSEESLLRFPCIVVAPQLPYNSWWHYRVEVEALLNQTAVDYSVDANRRYITGLSWGGMGTWSYVANWPDYWAAAIPICGHANTGGAYNLLDEIPDMPIWAFHAANDTVVGVEGTDTAVMEHRRWGGNAHYTRYASAGHNAWTPAYQTPQLVEWVMSQSRDDSGSGVAHVEPLPYISIDTAIVGSTLRLEGRIRGEARGDGPAQDLQIDSVYWWSNEIECEARGWDATVNGRSITSTSASFNQDDVGKRILLGNNAFDRWNGYEIVTVTHANTVEVAEWLGNASSVYWELNGPGSRYMPAEVTGLEAWAAEDIPLSPGVNRIHVVGRASSQSTYGGYAWLGGDTIEVNLPNPGPPTSSLDLSLDAPAAPGALLTSEASEITLSGVVTGAGGSSTLSWENNRGGDGSVLTNGTWSLPSIPLKKGYNRIRISITDTDGFEVSHILWVVRNVPPETPPRQYFQAYPDSVQTFTIEGDLDDSDGWPSARPFLGGVNASQNGSIDYADGIIEYAPNPGFVGIDRFTYELSDGFQRSTGVVTLTVGGSLGPETGLLDLDFNSASVPADLVASAPSGAGFLDDLSSEADGGAWSINSSALRLDRPAIGGSESGAGFRKLLPDCEAVVIQFDLRVTASYQGFWSDLIVIDLGDFSGVSEYDGWVSGSQIADNLRVVGRGTSNMSLAQGGTNPVWEDTTDGSTIEIIWFANAADTARSWQDPDGVLHTVDPHASTLLVNGVVVGENSPRNSEQTYSGFDELLVLIKGNAAATIEFDNFTVDAIGETPEDELAVWRESEGLAADGSQDDTPAANGTPQIINYAFGIDPAGSMQHSVLDELAMPQIIMEGDMELSILARSASSNPGVIYEVEHSANLNDWSFLDTLPNTESVNGDWVRLNWPITDSDDPSFFRVVPVTVE